MTRSLGDYPWIVPHERQRQNLADFPHLRRWFETIATRPATRRAYARVQEVNPTPVMDEAAKRILFDQDASLIT